jgi:uncharacterized protein YbcI
LSSTVLPGELAASISNAVVHLLSQYTGRGPTKARTYISDDLISVVLRDTLTQGERSLIADGKRDLVLGTRKAYQDAMGPDLIAAVEVRSGREVLAFLSSTHIDPDVAIESFVLRPRPQAHAAGERAASGAAPGEA